MKPAAEIQRGTDTITVLTAFRRVLAKRWQRDGTITPYDDALQFRVTEVPVSSLAELAEALGKLADDPHSAIIRGTYVGDAAAAELMPELIAERAAAGHPVELHPGAVFRRGRLFRDRPCRWIMLDIDGFETEADPVHCPEAACREFVFKNLPAEFQRASFYWSLSGSAGAPKNAGKLKAHLWFWLAKPYTSAQLRSWARAMAGIDASLFQPVQLHYTAAPVFFDEAADPVAVRSGLSWSDVPEVASIEVQEAEGARATTEGKVRPMKDPGEKPGIVGAFCRVFRPHDLLQLMPEEFEQGRDARHFTWLDHDVPDGVYITSCGHGLVNVHNTAPTGTGKRFNVFDFIRLHRFGYLDDEIAAGRPMHKRPSWSAMLDWVNTEFPEVGEEAGREQVGRVEASAEATSGVCGDGAGSTKDEVIGQLRAMTREEVASQWVTLAKHLPRSESALVVDEVAHLIGARHRRPLLDALKEAQEQDRRARMAARHRDRVAGRGVIRYEVENKTEVAREIERLIVERIPMEAYFEFGGQLSRLAINPLPGSRHADSDEAAAPPVLRIETLNDVNVLELIERVAVLEAMTESGVRPIAVPQHIVKILLDKSAHTCRRVAGLVTHALAVPGGKIVGQDGLDDATGLYFSQAKLTDAHPYDHVEAAAALQRLRMTFLLDFSFRSELDADCAIAALITGVQRPMLDIAPGVAVLAPGQSSGKTTLARRIHLVLTGHDMPVIPFPEANEDEVAKQLLATLLCAPATVCFDNLTDGTTFRSGGIAAAMTAPVFRKRILGESREVTCPTNTLFMLTGNNISLGADEVTRWLTVHLRPRTDRPDRREFAQPDVVTHALSIRHDVLRDVVGLVAGYMVSGASMPTRSRFPMWDRVVRQALIWAGAADVAEVFSANTDAAEETQAYRGLILLLQEAFGDRTFTASAVAALATFGRAPDPASGCGFQNLDFDDEGAPAAALVKQRACEILSALRARDPRKAESVGRVLKAATGRPVDAPDLGLIQLIKGMRDGYATYRIGPV